MKLKELNISSIILLCILSSGCKDMYDASSYLHPSLDGKYLRASQSDFNHLSPDKFSDNFKVECHETAWKFTTIPDWLSLSPSFGSMTSDIILDGQENTSGDARTSIFYLESDDEKSGIVKTMSVSQGGVEASVTVEPTQLSFKGSGETNDVLIISNCEWNAKTSQEWLSLNLKSANELSITSAANLSDDYREATVYITYGRNKTIPISITQFPSSISSSETILKYGNDAARYIIKVTSDVSWTATASDSWIKVDPSEGYEGITEVSVEVAPNMSTNSRKGYVAFNTGDNERFQIAIEQDGLLIESESELTFRSIESSQKVEIRSNTDWSIKTSSDWLTVSDKSGKGNAEVTVKVSDNPDSSQRSGSITIFHEGLSLEWTIHVTQLGKNLEADETLLEFDDKKGALTFKLISDGPWSSSCSDLWFTAQPSSGIGDETITVSVDENTDDNARTGHITYSFGNQNTEVQVKQAGKYFEIENNVFEFDSHGGSHNITLSTNEKWKAEIIDNVEWLVLSPSNGAAGDMITLTCEDNPSVNSRSAEILITPENLQPVKIKVTQRSRFLKISSESITFFADGGTSPVVSIQTDGTYSISSDCSWFSINKKEETDSFTVTASEYKQPDTRIGKITITLTDLKEGSLSLEISVIQTGEGCSFVIDGYTEDGDWNDFGNSSLQFTVTGYQSDQNWNSKYESKIVITITGYNDDCDWNTDKTAESDFDRAGYTLEQDWDNQ